MKGQLEMKGTEIKKLSLAAMFIAIGLLLPFLTGQIKQIGNMLLPMHIPVLLCGLVCGKYYGAAVGFILPLMRSVLFGMPAMFPSASAMAFELAAYGFIVGMLYSLFKRQDLRSLYLSLLGAMLGGRIIWGIVMSFMMGFGNFTFKAFLTSAFLNAVPGMILQLLLIPSVMLALDKTKLVPFKREDAV